jgi:hypothetical protein
VPLNETSLTATGAWTRQSNAAYYLGTFISGSANGIALTRTNARAKRLAVVATMGPGMGTINVEWNGTVVGTFNLDQPTLARKQVLAVTPFASAQTGTVRIVVATSGLPVEIDGLGVRPN